jgi:hypothetical protein
MDCAQESVMSRLYDFQKLIEGYICESSKVIQKRMNRKDAKNAKK